MNLTFNGNPIVRLSYVELVNQALKWSQNFYLHSQIWINQDRASRMTNLEYQDGGQSAFPIIVSNT